MKRFTIKINDTTYFEYTREELHAAGVGTEIIEAHALSECKSEKLKTAADVAQGFIDALINDKSPAFEQATYALQSAESAAWAANNKAVTPVLDGIAAARGIPANVLKAKAAEKSIAYQSLCAKIVGQRQKIEDMVKAAETIDAVEAIVIEFSI